MDSVETAPMSDEDNMVRQYKAHLIKKILFIILCLVIVIVAVGISLGIGSREIGFERVYELLFNHIIGVQYPEGSVDWVEDAVVWDFRLPRTLFAIIAGAALAVAGVAMQGVMNNPLADPYTTGISSGACFGVSVSIILGLNIAQNQFSNLGQIVNAFIFSLIPVALILVISPKTKSSPATLILAGTAIAYIFNALNTFMMVTTEEETLAEVYLWQVGSIVGMTWDDIPLVFFTTVIGVVIIGLLSQKLNILSLGETSAKSLGIDVDGLRSILLVVMAFMVAAVVSYAGIIGFLGLVTPHIVRMLIDSDNKYVIPASALFSGALLLTCDVVSRIVSPMGEVAVGVVISFVGAPIFLYLLVRKNANLW